MADKLDLQPELKIHLSTNHKAPTPMDLTDKQSQLYLSYPKIMGALKAEHKVPPIRLIPTAIGINTIDFVENCAFIPSVKVILFLFFVIPLPSFF